LQLGAAAERIAGILADRGVDVSGRTILRWVQKFGPALSEEIRRYRKPVSTTWLVDETYVKILGEWHYLFRGVDEDGQVLDCWLSRTRDLAAAEAFFRRTINSTGRMPEHVVTDKATFYPSAIRTCAPGAKHTSTGFYNRVISTNRCERNHGYMKSRVRPMRGLKSFKCAMRLFPALGRVAVSRARLRAGAANWSAVHRWPQLRARPPHRDRHQSPGPDLVGPNEHNADGTRRVGASGPHANVGEPVDPLAARVGDHAAVAVADREHRAIRWPLADAPRVGWHYADRWCP
jgi:transposase-like protein